MGGNYMNGYMNGANTELELKRINAASKSRMEISGTSHHFFSCLRNIANSLDKRHIECAI